MMNFVLAVLAGLVFPEWTDAAVFLSGASSMEEMSEDQMCIFEKYRERPLKLNYVSTAVLQECILFSEYQAASIADYRERNGDILSLTEFSLIDGIGEESSQALQYFISFESGENPGQRKYKKKLHAEINGRYVHQGKAGIKSRWQYGENIELCAGNKSWSATISSRNGRFKVILGDFNANFGQGGALWSGFSLNNYTSPSAFCRKPNGINACNSFSSEHLKGIAGSAGWKSWKTTVLACIDGKGIGVGANIGKTWRTSRAGVTAYFKKESEMLDGRIAADFKKGIGYAQIFAEAGWDTRLRSIFATGGVVYEPEYGKSCCTRLRYAANDYSGIALGYINRILNSSLDIAYHPSKSAFQLKSLTIATLNAGNGSCRFTASLRNAERFRPKDAYRLRSEIRGTAELRMGIFSLKGRADAVWCRQFAWQWNVEAGCSSLGKFSIYLKGGIFKVDCWEDRIYVYERDAPGNFNVPAYYGRGFKLSAVAGFKAKLFKAVSISIYARAAITRYPWIEKAASDELKLQTILKF